MRQERREQSSGQGWTTVGRTDLPLKRQEAAPFGTAHVILLNGGRNALLPDLGFFCTPPSHVVQGQS